MTSRPFTLDQIGEYITDWLIENHESQVSLAELMPISRITLSKWIHGKAYPRDQAIKRMQQLGILPVLDDDGAAVPFTGALPAKTIRLLDTFLEKAIEHLSK